MSLNHVRLTVWDVDASQAFYERVLGISEVSRQFNGVNLGLGESFLGLYDVEARGQIHHFCVGVEGYELEGHAEKLRELGVEPRIRQDRPELYLRTPMESQFSCPRPSIAAKAKGGLVAASPIKELLLSVKAVRHLW